MSGPKALRRFVQDVGDELVDAVLDLAEADQLGMVPQGNSIPGLREKLEGLKTNIQKADVLPLDGNDVQRLLGIKQGKVVGEALKYLKDAKYEWELAGKEMSKEDAEKLVLDRFGDVRK